MVIRIATRKSRLALIQTDLFVSKLKECFPDITYEIVPVITTGDKITDKNLYDIGGKALFLKELEEKLIAGQADLAVHSLKDVPGILPKELKIAAVLKRDDPRDCFVSYKYKSLQELPNGAVVGSSSVRRKVILQKIRPDLKVVQFRGNVKTRLAKLLEKDAPDAIILACAGLKRLEMFNEKYCFPLTVDEMIPSAGQGVIAIQKRVGDQKMLEICNKINHMPTWYLSQAEREFLAYFDASCRTAISAYAEYIDMETIRASYMYGDFEGSLLKFSVETGLKTHGKQIALKAAKTIESKLL
ncbi:MAG: hydroxymethylbilane synthase [Rickettsiaceae bacterium]